MGIRRKYCIIGYGNVGRMLGHALVKENNLLMLSRRLTRGRKKYSFRTPHGFIDVEVETANINDDVECEYGFLTVKAYDALEVAEKLSEKVSIFFPVQNGLGVYEKLSQSIGRRRVHPLIVTYGVRGCGENCSQLAGEGELVFGCKPANICKEASEALWKGGYKSRIVEETAAIIWQKALVNIAINPITALTRRKNKAIIEESGLWRTAVHAVLEGLSVATAKGIVLKEDPIDILRKVAESTGENMSSMLQDILSCRKTEIDFLNGYICDRGLEMGLDVRVNCSLASLVKALERSVIRECRIGY